MNRSILFATLAIAAFALPATAQTDAEDRARAERWQALQSALFGERELLDGSNVIQLDAPPRAMDAAIVPVGLTLTGAKPVKAVYLVIDQNPSPLAAHVTFGPRADPAGTLRLRVRVNEYTLMHAVAETPDGELYVTEKFVKAAGGCSAPAGPDDKAALKDLGRMKLRLTGEFSPARPQQAQLMIRHPNFNGMQMNQITRMYTPAHFIRSTEVTFEGERVFHLASDISISTDPVFTFGFVPDRPGKLQVTIEDSKDGRFEQSFQVPAAPAS